MSNLRKAALTLSDALHASEESGWEIPTAVDMAWAYLTQALEEPHICEASGYKCEAENGRK